MIEFITNDPDCAALCEELGLTCSFDEAEFAYNERRESERAAAFAAERAEIERLRPVQKDSRHYRIRPLSLGIVEQLSLFQ